MSTERASTAGAENGAPGQATYPTEFDCDVTTLLGTTVHVRPIRPQDAPRLAAFHEALSPRSVYMRFFSPHPKLSESELRRFTNVDYADRLALVAEIDGRLVGVGRYDRSEATSEAEVAFVVADEWHHHGIASSLLELLARAAWLCGIDSFRASTLADNTEMLHVFTHSRFDVTTHFECGVIDISFPITPSDPARDADVRGPSCSTALLRNGAG